MMKTNMLRYTAVALAMLSLWGCTPDDYTLQDNETVDLSTIGRVELVPEHRLVIADGNAQLDLRPRVYTKDGFLIPDRRVDEKWLEYEASQGTTITRYFSTSDAALVGKTLTTRVKIKGTDVVSEPVEFEVVAPLEKKYESEITIPVIFHIVQTEEDIDSYGGMYTDSWIEQLLVRMNHVFSGVVTRSPVGVDTHIRFRFAEYKPDGKRMLTPGINRLTIGEIDAENGYEDFIVENHLDWPAQDYMNIWLISDREKNVEYFGTSISANCQPRYVWPDAPAEVPEGLRLRLYTEGTDFSVAESGIIYRLQNLDQMNRTAGYPGEEEDNELIHYVGRYLGLMPAYSFLPFTMTDYCEDTHFYFLLNLDTGNLMNTGWYKEANGFYFRSENIMDDPVGLHATVSKNQCERIRWVLENCPDRAAWKSDFAFTGTE